MRNSKKFLTLVLAVLMIMSTVAFSTSAASFTDVKIDTKALYQATGLLSDLGVAKGTTETTFSPGDNVTREQMAAFVYRLMKAGKSVEGGTNTSTFTDLVDPTFFFMVSWANNQGIIKGRSETSFDPKGGITLQDAYTMVIRALGYEKKETVAYPYGYIDIAEDLGLDANLPSTLKYTDTLTRGDVAIILYNTFFADMAEGETTYKYEATDSTPYPIAVPVTIYPTVAEKIFGVKKDTQRVIATPNYYLDNATIDNNFDTDVLLFNGNAGYRTFEELGLTGKADDYFLSDFTLYLKDETKTDGTVETKVLYAEPLLTKKTVSKATVGKVTPIKGTDYYAPETKSYAKASGLLTIDGVKAYLYNAPYSYTKPQITNEIAADPVKYYEALNENDVEFIGLAPEEDEGVSHFVSSAYNAKLEGQYKFDIGGLPEKTLYDGVHKDGSENTDVYTYSADVFTNELNQIYNEGYYELDTYDSDSDGVIDYIWYKPYTFGQAIKDEDFATVDMHKNNDVNLYDADSAVMSEKDVPTIYTYGATIAGATFKDKDFVIAYVNGPANYIKVAATVEKTSAEIKSYNGASYNIVLKNGTTMNTWGTSKLLVNFGSDSESGAEGEAFNPTNSFGYLYAAKYLGTTQEFYVYGGRLLYTDAVAKAKFDVTGPIIIPQDNKSSWGTALEGGYLVKRPAITAFVSGTGTSSVVVPVEVENNDPETRFSNVGDGYYNFGAYAGRINSFTEADGVYTLVKAVKEVTDYPYPDSATQEEKDAIDAKRADIEQENLDAIEALKTTEETAQYGFHVNESILKKVTGTTYQFIDPTTSGDAAILPNGGLYVSLQSYTKIIIKSLNENGSVIFTEYGASKLPNISNTLNNIDVILLNNPSSTRTEYLAALYAEVYGVINQATDISDTNDNIRIVKTNSVVDSDASGTYHFYYDVYNPFTGAVESNIPGFKGTTKASGLVGPASIGKFYEVINGVLQDKSNPWYNSVNLFPAGGTFSSSLDINADVDRKPGHPTPANLVQIANYAGNELEIKNDDTIYKTDSDTKVIMLEAGGSGKNDFKWAVSSAKTLADLGSTSVSLRNYCTTISETGKITTEYADNIEAFFRTDANKSIAGQYQMVDFIIILRDKVSDVAFLNSNDVA